MLSIGDFARFAGVSVRMLRHYDTLGLLVPAYVDPATGYRHYAADQFPRINRLVALKDLGFTLDQVGPILDAELGAEQLRGMLLLRQAQITTQIGADQARLAAIEARLRTIEREGTMSDLEFVEKSLPAVLLAQLTDEVGGVDEIGGRIGPMFGRLSAGLEQAGVSTRGPAVAWYEGRGERTGIAAGVPVTEAATAQAAALEGVDVEKQPAVERAVTVVHHGGMETIGQTWQALERHVEDQGMRSVGRCREVYLATPEDQPDEWVTELQQPVT